MNTALILSGGVGSRIRSDTPKQYISVAGRMIVTRCIEAVLQCKDIDALQIVADDAWQEAIKKEAAEAAGEKFLRVFRGFSEPGANRQLSIYHGLCDIASYEDPKSPEKAVVIVHDAARPGVSAQTLHAVISACQDMDGAMPALPMKDTVYESADGRRISKLLDRGKIYAGQAPEAFRLFPYLEANKALLPEKILTINGASEPAILAGMTVAMLPGDEANFKITTQEDLKRYIEAVTRMEKA
ncbi:MAG: 2-C-methyl-D-erythritol 4-phosphate cytidylyltransferase [Lachnospiraceae bacterium]|nr:2-C-methyl-D-erythritol 4-phosphate cytidylyltransferase [Lachnospiraceae bacterium]